MIKKYTLKITTLILLFNILLNNFIALSSKTNASELIDTSTIQEKSISNLEKQNEIICKLNTIVNNKTGYIKNFNELNTLNKNNICVNSETLNELDSVTSIDELYTKILFVDLLNENNLDNSLKNIIELILSNDISNTSFSSNFNEINKNTNLKNELTDLSNYLSLSRENLSDRQVNILKKLNKIQFLLKSNSINENSIDTYFGAMKKAYQVIISKRISRELLNKKRKDIIDYLQNNSEIKDSSLSGNIGYNGFIVGIASQITKEEGKTEKSFYEVEIGGGLKLSLGYSLGLGAGNIKTALNFLGESSADITTSTIFFSLEQFLDAQTDPSIKNKSSTYLTQDTIKELIDDRKKLVKTEKELIACFNFSIEFYLRAANIIPVSVNIIWPNLTRASEPVTTTNKSISCDAKAIAEVLNSSLNCKSTISSKKITQRLNNSIIKVINDDCSPNLDLSIDDIVKEFASKNSLYFKIKNDFEELLKSDCNKKFNERTLPIIVSQMNADLRQYCTNLSIISDKFTSEELKESSLKNNKELEKKWVGHSNILDSYKDKFLKNAITVCTYLRQFAKDEYEISMFKKLYNELSHILEMKGLDKIYSKKLIKLNDNKIKTKKSYYEYSISGNTSANLGKVSKASTNVTYTKTIDEPGYGNSDDLTITITMPLIDNIIEDLKNVKNEIINIIKNIPKNEINLEEAFLNIWKLLENNNQNEQSCELFNGLNIAGLYSSKNNLLKLSFEFTKIDKSKNIDSIIPIENQKKLVNKRDSWILKCLKISSQNEVSIGLSENINAEIAEISGNVEKNKSSFKTKIFKLGDKCLDFPLSRFNLSSICSKDSGESTIKNYLWTSFKESNKNTLYKLFLNVANTDSIAYYQVQSIYNDILSELEKPTNIVTKNACKKIFSKFISTCQALKCIEEFEEEYYNETLKLFEEVLEFNFQHNFYKKLNSNWKIEKRLI